MSARNSRASQLQNDLDSDTGERETKRRKREGSPASDMFELYIKAQILSSKEAEQPGEQGYLSEEDEQAIEDAAAQRSAIILLPHWAAEFSMRQRKFLKGWAACGMLEMRRLNTRINAWHTFGCIICQTFLEDDVQKFQDEVRKAEERLREARRAARDFSLRRGYMRWRTKAGTAQEEEIERADNKQHRSTEPEVLRDDQDDYDMDHRWEECPRKKCVEELQSWISALGLPSNDTLDWSTYHGTCHECGLSQTVCTNTNTDAEACQEAGAVDQRPRSCNVTRQKVWAVVGCIWLWGGRLSRGKEREIHQWVQEKADEADVEREEREKMLQGRDLDDNEQSPMHDTEDSEDIENSSEDGEFLSGDNLRDCLLKETFSGIIKIKLLFRMLSHWG